MTEKMSIGVMTSGGDAQGMNAAVRSVVATALSRDIEVFAIYEGYQGMVEGGDLIRPLNANAIGGILQRAGTILGTARSKKFHLREGLLAAARNLITRGIDRLVIIGGDGSLAGANEFREEWPSLVNELKECGEIDESLASQYPALMVVGLVGSIDNDMFGTDMTIGADSALHRITEAVDAISSTAASHQRSFVVEVMGRNCGYLALMAAIACAADWVMIPEHPPLVEDWEARMCELMEAGRKAGRRDSIVIVAEGAQDRNGNHISADYVRKVLEDRLNQDTRVTILGHVQRGGTPSAFDRLMSSFLGYHAVEAVQNARPEDEPVLIGIRENRVTRSPLMECVKQTRAVASTIKAGDYDQAMAMRGGSFREAFANFRTLVRTRPRISDSGDAKRLAIFNAGSPAPGMNTAVRAATRLALDQGHEVLAVHNGFRGLVENQIEPLGWMDVGGWASAGGSELGTLRRQLNQSDLYAIARNLENHNIQGMLMIGGWSGYQAAHRLITQRENFPSFRIPIICLPASIDNNLPGSELSVGVDTALNTVVSALDKIKQSAVATQRVFVVEVMGSCGYLALMSGVASGAERVYLPEETLTLRDLEADVEAIKTRFRQGKRLGLLIRNENIKPVFDTSFLASLFRAESQDLFEVRQAILGHIQQGGAPTPFDRIQATRMAARCVPFLIEKIQAGSDDSAMIGLCNGRLTLHDLHEFPRMVDIDARRPRDQYWLASRHIAKVLAQLHPPAG